MLRLKNHKFVILILVLFIIIVPLLIAIFSIDNKITTLNTLKGYASLKEKINNISANDPDIAETVSYQKMVSNILLLENDKLSLDQKKGSLYNAKMYLIEAYSITHKNTLYDLQIDLNNFAIQNFKNADTNFVPTCLDPTCSPRQAEEIAKVIEEIKNSKLPQYQKESDIANLTNVSYLSNKMADVKAGQFLTIASMIKNYPEYIKLNLNEKISKEIEDYVKKDFSQQYAKYKK